jgi:flagellar motility protein MotE (MotC chaperone)
MKSIRKHLRLLPAVIAMAGMVLAVKSVGFAIEARAQDNAAQTQADAQTPAPPAQAAHHETAADSAGDDSESASASEVDVLTSLSKRRAELDTRAADIAGREALLEAAEKRVDTKIADLKQLQSQIEQLLGQRDTEAQKQLDALVKTYASMKPRDAARIFNTLNDQVLLAVAGEMKPDVLGAILAAMSPDAAEKLTVKLAARLKLPAETPAAPPAPPPAVAQAATAAPALDAAPAQAPPAPAGG